MPEGQRQLFVPNGNDPHRIERAFQAVLHYLRTVSLTEVSDWEDYAAGEDFNSSTPNDHTVTMLRDHSGILSPGSGCRITSGGDELYALVNTNAGVGAMTVLGPAISGATLLEALLNEGRVRTERVLLPGDWCDGTNDDLMDHVLDSEFVWRGPDSYLVALWVKGKTVGTSPVFNISNASASGNNILSSGITVTTSWKDSEANIDKAEYLVAHGSKLFLRCTTAGIGASNALSLNMVFVAKDQEA